MSTIGEALRKVQKQRMTGIPAPQDPPHAASHAPHPLSPGPSTRTPVFLAILIGVLLVSGAVLYLFRGATFSIVVDGRSLPFANTPENPRVSPPESKLTATVPAPAVTVPVPPSVAGGTIAATPILTNTPPVVSAESPKQDKEQAAKPLRRNEIVRTDLPALGGIFYSDKNPVAIINGSSMMEGEKTGRFLIVKIGVYSVTLKDENGEFEIRLK